MNNSKTYVVEMGGKPLTIETGDLAMQAGGAVMVRLGDSVVLCTATASKTPREGIDFFPLSVDFEERLYAAGRIPGSFFRREGRPSESAILTSRLIDRPLRPLFPKDITTTSRSLPPPFLPTARTTWTSRPSSAPRRPS